MMEEGFEWEGDDGSSRATRQVTGVCLGVEVKGWGGGLTDCFIY